MGSLTSKRFFSPAFISIFIFVVSVRKLLEFLAILHTLPLNVYSSETTLDTLSSFAHLKEVHLASFVYLHVLCFFTFLLTTNLFISVVECSHKPIDSEFESFLSFN